MFLSDSHCGVCVYGHWGLELVNRPWYTKGKYLLPFEMVSFLYKIIMYNWFHQAAIKVFFVLFYWQRFLVFSFCSSGLFLFFIVESSFLHHKLHHSYSSFLCRHTQTSCGTINVSFVRVLWNLVIINMTKCDLNVAMIFKGVKYCTLKKNTCGLLLWPLVLQYCCPLSDSFSRIQHVMWWCKWTHILSLWFYYNKT